MEPKACTFVCRYSTKGGMGLWASAFPQRMLAWTDCLAGSHILMAITGMMVMHFTILAKAHHMDLPLAPVVLVELSTDT